jgi:hypothetical protein
MNPKMKVVVVYESMFGNTKTIGEAVAEGLREAGEVMAGTVDELSPDDVRDAELIVAGGPTHAHGMARRDAHAALSKDASFNKYGPVLPGRPSMRAWLEDLPTGFVKAAAFDTRYDKPPFITGSAAKKIAGMLDANGYTVVATKSFFVQTAGGPLAEGERERALEWGRELAAKVKPIFA